MTTISSRYDINNYSSTVTAIIDKPDYYPIETVLRSNLLLIKWKLLGSFKSADLSNLIGTFRIHRKTPLGELEPVDFNLKVNNQKQNYIQFLDVPQSEFGYKIDVLNPVGVVKSTLQILEYTPPTTFINNSNPNMSSTYGNDQIVIDNSAIAAAILAGDAATISAINALPNNVADAIANNAMNTQVSPPLVIGTTAVGVLPSDPNRQVVEIANRGNTKMRIRVSNVAPAASTTYQNIDFTTELIAAVGAVGSIGYKAGGTWVASPEQAKSPIYIISDGAGGSIVTTTTVTAP
jgi:hypothetical protein